LTILPGETMSTGSSNTRRFGRILQIRWKEALGLPGCPYLYRWTLILFGYSIRLHHWIKSDDRRYFHDHSCDLISIIIKGKYKNVTPDGTFEARAWRPRKMKATVRHYLDIPKEGAWTVILCGKPYHKWGFYVNGVKWRPLRYFHKFGIIQTADYQ
jgi:hypothetical protein